jgi:hypothetical protein
MTEKEPAPPAKERANVTPLRVRRDDTVSSERQRKFRRKLKGAPPSRRGLRAGPEAVPDVAPAAPEKTAAQQRPPPAVAASFTIPGITPPAIPSVMPSFPVAASAASLTRPPAASSPAMTLAAALGTDIAAYLAVAALAVAAAFFSIKGMVVLFPGAPAAVVGMALAMESAKLVTTGWLARRWRDMAWIWRSILVSLIIGLAVINGVGVFSQLVAAHVGERGMAAAGIEMHDAALAARIDVQSHTVEDLDRQLLQIDTAIEESARRGGRPGVTLTAIDGQRKSRQALAGDRRRQASTLADLKAERAALGAKGRQLETDAVPIRYVAEMLGVDTDSERAIRWLIVLMVLTCDPLAIALTAAVSARKEAR